MPGGRPPTSSGGTSNGVIPRGRRRRTAGSARTKRIFLALQVAGLAVLGLWAGVAVYVTRSSSPPPVSSSRSASGTSDPRNKGPMSPGTVTGRRAMLDKELHRLRGMEKKATSVANVAERAAKRGFDALIDEGRTVRDEIHDELVGILSGAGNHEEEQGGGDERRRGNKEVEVNVDEQQTPGRAERAALAAVHETIAAPPPRANGGEEELIDMRQLTSTLPFDNPDGGAWKQGWDIEPIPLDKSDPLTVFVIPHAHCDPGWIKTFDEYFRQQTRAILTTVYNALMKDDRRRFIWAEISYFEWWWREQNESVHANVKKLVEEGRLEFVTGGWVQPDEANTQRYAIEVQLQEGHDWLRATFGDYAVPQYGWSIDPFGYSPTMADVLKEYGFRGMLIQRVHYAVKKELAKRKHLEFKWRQTWDSSGKHDIFTHVMPFYSYDAPHSCGPDPKVCCQFDFARLNNGYGGCPWKVPPVAINDDNVAQRAKMILDQYQKKAALYRSKVVLIPLGDDFRYRNADEAEKQYNNYQKIFDYLNRNVDGVNIRFGTLSDYFKAVEGKFEPPVLKGSFFTYADRDQDYWSGYFTSRVFDKALDRRLERVLYAATSMGATKEEMQSPRRALSLFQHHDGVTGTAKNHVVEDYARAIHQSINFVQEWMVKHMDAAKEEALAVNACWKSDSPRGLDHNLCAEKYPLYVYNPLATEQRCGDKVVPGHKSVTATLPCEHPGPLPSTTAGIQFDPTTGQMTSPFKEEWMVWKVRKGGAYLFVPENLVPYQVSPSQISIEKNGYVVRTPSWTRTVVEKEIPAGIGGAGTSTVIDMIYETNLQKPNEEWLVRLTSGISNNGVFHTDLNGFNFDTHHFRKDLPIQSQVFPMPTLASIQDSSLRFTVLSEHAQGTATLKDGSIDLWLDRRLKQDDDRGLGQGVMDNVLTRTRLRVLMESDGYAKDPDAEFEITKLCQRMWDELNHPLEMFGTHNAGGVSEVRNKKAISNRIQDDKGGDGAAREKKAGEDFVPFVYMVHKRVDYLKRAIASLRSSDFPVSTAPLIISHDGRVPVMIEYVSSLKNEFNVVELFHPHACYDNPNSFPGDEPALNIGYAGDQYGNERSSWATCTKHHFSWMMKTVWGLNLADAMVFMEEDYLVAPTIYETVTTGLDLLERQQEGKDGGFFGMTLDITDGGIDGSSSKTGWVEKAFRTGPMVMQRNIWDAIVAAKEIFCTFDDYNWDWSLMQMQALGRVPYRVLTPSTPQVHHIGVSGMHAGANEKIQAAANEEKTPEPFHGKEIVAHSVRRPRKQKGNGGWGHPKDHEHCLSIMSGR